MSIKHLTKVFEALLEGNESKAEAMLKASLELSFKSMVKEGHKIKYKTTCPECDGKGEHEDLNSAKNNDLPVECSHCGGSGYIENKNSHLPVKESTNEYDEPETYNYFVGHSKGKRTIFPHPKGKIPTQDTHPEHDEGIAGPYKTKKEAFNAAQGRSKVKESTLVESSPIESKIEHADENGVVRKHKNGKYSFKHNSKLHKLEFHATKEESKAALARHNRDYGKVKESDEIKDDILNELKASTLGNYVKKAASDAADHAHLSGYVDTPQPKGSKFKNEPARKKARKHEEKRHKGIAKATDKLVKKAKE